MQYDDAIKQVEDLVERFERNIDRYKNGAYNEAQVRQEFLNPKSLDPGSQAGAIDKGKFLDPASSAG